MEAIICAKIKECGGVTVCMTIDGIECTIRLSPKHYCIFSDFGNLEHHGHVELYLHEHFESAEAVLDNFFHNVHKRGLLYNDNTGRLAETGFLTVKETAFMTREEPVECCVCLEATFQKTKCGHSICRRCTYKLKESICPLCRGGLYEEEDEEEDA